MASDKRHKPNLWWSMFAHKCPRCRRGDMFNDFSAYNLKHTLDMKEHCDVCGQKMEPEVGFWYGTGYVSYALAVAITVAGFIASMVLFRVSFMDNSVLWWLGANCIFLILIQPWLMRISRSIYLYFFIRYDEEYDTREAAKEFH